MCNIAKRGIYHYHVLLIAIVYLTAHASTSFILSYHNSLSSNQRNLFMQRVLYLKHIQKRTSYSATSFTLFTSNSVDPDSPYIKNGDKSKNKSKAWKIDGPPVETKPDYENIHGPLGPFWDRIFLIIFRSRMAEKVGMDSNAPKDDYKGLMELAGTLNLFYSDRQQVQKIAQDILRSLFPSWLPGAFAVMFAKPLPKFSSRMNAWATRVAGTWLMGECELNDCKVDGGGIGHNQGLLVKRCRFLEESGCASVCINSCKIPTQQFFLDDMGLPLTMTPDYETGECQFSFGLTPTPEEEFDVKNIPCLSRCPTAGGLRLMHSRCQMMEDGNNNTTM